MTISSGRTSLHATECTPQSASALLTLPVTSLKVSLTVTCPSLYGSAEERTPGALTHSLWCLRSVITLDLRLLMALPQTPFLNELDVADRSAFPWYGGRGEGAAVLQSAALMYSSQSTLHLSHRCQPPLHRRLLSWHVLPISFLLWRQVHIDRQNASDCRRYSPRGHDLVRQLDGVE